MVMEHLKHAPPSSTTYADQNPPSMLVPLAVFGPYLSKHSFRIHIFKNIQRLGFSHSLRKIVHGPLKEKDIPLCLCLQYF